MKHFFAFAVILTILFVSCENTNEGNSEIENENTTLMIQNESFSEITDVMWSSVPFTQNTESIRSGFYRTMNVNEDSGYIYFKRKTDPINARTDQIVIVEKNEQKIFVIEDNTVIVDVDNQNNKGTFGSLGVIREPQITVQVGTSIIEQLSNYDFGSILFNEKKEITFTIGNSGKADLKLNVIGGNIINLSGNTSMYFSVVQQPFTSVMTIPPESTTTFVISFNPKTIGNNFDAEVNISSNSNENADFAFRIKGNGRSYIIGDTGPGNGMVFYVDGNQYKECSGELGEYSWNNAISTAKNYKGGGFTDWYLPTIEDLNLMVYNLLSRGLGGFSNNSYWSSTEVDDQNALTRFFNLYGDQYINNKYYTYRVRAVRAFTF
ncbi:MAG: DUF1566 domain-containing protein [Treponema sp.]|nr:DUF1566 domain-containing protein [Treponema sp.]